MRVLLLGVAMMVAAVPSRGAELCLAPSAANARNISVDCLTGTGNLNVYTGYGDTLPETCIVGPCPTGENTDCPCGASGPFFWQVSRSDTDAYDNTGPLASSVLYLWLTVCTGGNDGFFASEFALEGSLPVEGFVPQNGFQNFGSVDQLLLTHVSSCVPPGTVLVGEIHVGTVHVEPAPWGAVKAGYR